MYWREDESSSKRKNIRLGHSRRACEVNRISGQQQEPPRVAYCLKWALVGIPVL